MTVADVSASVDLRTAWGSLPQAVRLFLPGSLYPFAACCQILKTAPRFPSYTEQEIADEVGISDDTVSRIVEESRKNDMWQKYGILSRYQEPDWNAPLYNVWKKQEKTNGTAFPSSLSMEGERRPLVPVGTIATSYARLYHNKAFSAP